MAELQQPLGTQGNLKGRSNIEVADRNWEKSGVPEDFEELP